MGFLNRFTKQSDATPASAAPAEPPELSPAPEEVAPKIAELEAELAEASGDEERIAILNRLGALRQSVGDSAAIDTFEASMAIREQYGPAYNALLALYNEQLQHAARSKDDAGIQKWTTKLDELMALSKRVMRSNY